MNTSDFIALMSLAVSLLAFAFDIYIWSKSKK